MEGGKMRSRRFFCRLCYRRQSFARRRRSSPSLHQVYLPPRTAEESSIYVRCIYAAEEQYVYVSLCFICSLYVFVALYARYMFLAALYARVISDILFLRHRVVNINIFSTIILRHFDNIELLMRECVYMLVLDGRIYRRENMS